MQAGWRGTDSYSRQLLISKTNNKNVGILIDAGLDLGTSAFGLMRYVPKPSFTFGDKPKYLFKKVPSDYERKYKQTTAKLLMIEGGTAATTIIDTVESLD